MVICNSGERLLQEATGIRHGRVYPVAKNWLVQKKQFGW